MTNVESTSLKTKYQKTHKGSFSYMVNASDYIIIYYVVIICPPL